MVSLAVLTRKVKMVHYINHICKGRYGALWEVLPTMELLLRHLTDLVDMYSPVVSLSEDHIAETPEYWSPEKDRYLRNSLELGWEKLDKYYRLTDNSSAYVAAIALHPCFKWRWIQKKWADRLDWQNDAEKALKKQWELYKTKVVTATTDLAGLDTINVSVHPGSRQAGRRRKNNGLECYMEEEFDSSSDDEEDLRSVDEYSRWQELPREKDVIDPIAYWYDTSRRSKWPHLSAFALDLFGVPAMSAEPERIFSSTGRMVRPDRGCLKADIIGAAACLKQWDRNGVIEWK
jgi:hypothetical protein